MLIRSRNADGVITDHERITDIVGRGGAPRWLVVSPHDDDVQIGAALTVLAAAEADIEVHVLVTSDGRMGFVDWEDRRATAATRAAECLVANEILGIPPDRVHKLDYPDGDLAAWQGVRDTPGGPRGISYDYARIIREVAPAVVLGPTPTDLHGDHRVTAAELDIACFHASGGIWRQLGDPVPTPERVDFAVYCDFPGPPDVQVRGNAAEFRRKLDAIAAYASQPEIIAAILEQVTDSGPVEYLQRRPWSLYRPGDYDVLFEK